VVSEIPCPRIPLDQPAGGIDGHRRGRCIERIDQHITLVRIAGIHVVAVGKTFGGRGHCSGIDRRCAVFRSLSRFYYHDRIHGDVPAGRDFRTGGHVATQADGACCKILLPYIPCVVIAGDLVTVSVEVVHQPVRFASSLGTVEHVDRHRPVHLEGHDIFAVFPAIPVGRTTGLQTDIKRGRIRKQVGPVHVGPGGWRELKCALHVVRRGHNRDLDLRHRRRGKKHSDEHGRDEQLGGHVFDHG